MNKLFGTATPTNQPVASPQAAPQNRNERPVGGKRPVSRRGRLLKLLASLLVVILLISGVLYVHQQITQTAINKNGYQAVFLTNGQVYFGKMHQGYNGYVAMTDIYYLQVQQAQPTGTAVKDGVANPQSTANADTQLVKLGQELHAPEDRMQISKDQILFWENINAEGKVAKAISDYKAKK